MGAFVDFLKSGGGSFAGSALGTAASFVSSAIGYDRQKALLRRQQAYQTAEREASQKWQEKMWQVQNDYSTPAAQMARLKAAGLNPDMFYSGSGVHGAASSVPGSTASGAPSVPNPAGQSGLEQGALMLGQSVKDAAEVRNINTNTNKLENEIENLRTVNLLNGKELVLKDWLIERQPDIARQLKLSIQNLDETNQKIAKDRELVQANIDIAKVDKDKRELDYKLALDTFDDQVYAFRLNNRELLAKIGITEKQLFWLDKFKKEELRLLTTNVDKATLDYDLAKLSKEMREQYEKDLGKESGFVVKRLIELDLQMKSTDNAMLQEQFDSFVTFNFAQNYMSLLQGYNNALYHSVHDWSSPYINRHDPNAVIEHTYSNPSSKRIESKRKKYGIKK